jgi:hypothetical protein
LFDRAGSSGSRECRRACAGLSRRLFEATADEISPDLPIRLVESGIRVLNIAGNRGSYLTNEASASIRDNLRQFLPEWAARWANRLAGDTSRILLGALPRHGRVAVPSSGIMAVCVRRAIQREDNELDVGIKRVIRQSRWPGIELIQGRSRDFPKWIARKEVDVAIAGLNDLLEGGWGNHPFFDTGMFASSLVLVSQGRARIPRFVVSQWPLLAKTLLRNTEYRHLPILPAHGAAESWLAVIPTAWCADTWFTGATARANGLAPVACLGETSLCIVWRSESVRARNIARHVATALSHMTPHPRTFEPTVKLDGEQGRRR